MPGPWPTSTASWSPAARSRPSTSRPCSTPRLPESVNLEYKEKYVDKVVDTVAAMANTYGGLILVGVAEDRATGVASGVTGVEQRTAEWIVDMCHSSLEPPFSPEVVPVELDGATVAVVRVDPDATPRPVVLAGKILVRREGRNAPADRYRIAALFSEPDSRRLTAEGMPRPPGLRGNTWAGQQPAFGFQARAGVRPTARTHAAILDTGFRESLNDTLSATSLTGACREWIRRVGGSPDGPCWRPHGHNSSEAATVELAGSPEGRLEPGAGPVSARCLFQLPAPPQGPPIVQVSVDLVVRAAVGADGGEGARLLLQDLYRFLDALLEAAGHAVPDSAFPALLGTPLWELLGPVVHLEPLNGAAHAILDLRGLARIDDTTGAVTGEFHAPGAIDFGDHRQRDRMVKDWLTRLLLDAGYTGFEQRVEGLA